METKQKESTKISSVVEKPLGWLGWILLTALFLILMITLISFFISMVSAGMIYAGESITLELEQPYEYYSVVGNSTEVILDVTQVGNTVTITPNKYSQNDSYEVIFFDVEKEIITVYQSSGGGGGGSTKWKTEYVDKNITEYVDKEIIKEVPGKETEVEKIVKKTSLWTWLSLGVFIILSLFLLRNIFSTNDLVSNTSERGFNKNENEQKINDTSSNNSWDQLGSSN